MRVSGKITELHTMTPIANVQITVVRKQDTLTTLQSDSLGNYAFQWKCSPDDIFEFNFEVKHHELANFNVKAKHDITTTLKRDVELVYQTVNHAPPRILFERNTSAPIPFNNNMYKELLEDNPNLCVEISHYAHPDEHEKLTKKRLLEFEKYLRASDFNMNQIDLNFTQHTLNCPTDSHCHAELFFEITSVEGHCLQE